MKDRLLAFTEGSSATLGMLIWWNPRGGWCSFFISFLSLPFLVSPSYYLTSKKTSSNKHANVFYSKTQRLRRWKMPHSREERWQPPSPLFVPTFPNIYQRSMDKKVRRTAGEKNQGIINLGLKRKMLLGILRTERGPLGPLFSPPFWNGWIWGWVCLLLGRRVWLCRTKRGQGGAQEKRARDRLL